MGRTRARVRPTPRLTGRCPRLVEAGLLRRIDAETVIPPRVVGQVMRGEAPGPVELTTPVLQTTSTTAADADAVAAGAAIDLLREIDLIIETLGSAPVPELRNGGLGVRDVKRLAKTTGIDEPRPRPSPGTGRGRGLIAAGMPDLDPGDGTGPTGRRRWPPTGSSNPHCRALAPAGGDVAGPARPGPP